MDLAALPTNGIAFRLGASTGTGLAETECDEREGNDAIGDDKRAGGGTENEALRVFKEDVGRHDGRVESKDLQEP